MLKTLLSWRDERDEAFTLPDTETDTEIEADTDNGKLAQNPIRICVGVCICEVETPLHNSIQPIFLIGIGVGHCEHTIKFS